MPRSRQSSIRDVMLHEGVDLPYDIVTLRREGTFGDAAELYHVKVYNMCLHEIFSGIAKSEFCVDRFAPVGSILGSGIILSLGALFARSTAGEGFNSIGLHNSSEKRDDQLIWKVFSPEPLTAEQSKKLFPNGPKCETVGWWAYPKYEATGKKLADAAFCLDGAGLYYCNAIEEAASAMEMAVLGAKNCVLLASNRLKGATSNIDTPSLPARL
ncbi:PCYOX1 [Symbiodinium sp. CCMP2456]|nr:PCYOX1 [Symbiodinium sp. CCMP2456]